MLFVAFLVFIQFIDGSKGDCQEHLNITGKHCYPSGKHTNTCITEAQNGSGLNWFGMQAKCAKNNGWLAWLRDDFNETDLIRTSVDERKKAFNFISIGMLMSVKEDNKFFLWNPSENTSLSCNKNNTSQCLPPVANKTQCDAVGCCWVNELCVYPENPQVREYGQRSVASTNATRRCVALHQNKDNNTWAFITYDCFNNTLDKMGFVCEYNCNTSAIIPTSVTVHSTNATDILPSSAIIPTSVTVHPTTAADILPSSAIIPTSVTVHPTTAADILPSSAIIPTSVTVHPTTAADILPSSAIIPTSVTVHPTTAADILPSTVIIPNSVTVNPTNATRNGVNGLSNNLISGRPSFQTITAARCELLTTVFRLGHTGTSRLAVWDLKGDARWYDGDDVMSRWYDVGSTMAAAQYLSTLDTQSGTGVYAREEIVPRADGTSCENNPSPKGSRCNPIGKPPASCITPIEDGLGLTWFDMVKNCTKDSGRLVWLKDDFNSVNLVSTEKLSSGTSFIAIGLLQSMKGDNTTFWRNPSDNNTMTCGPKDTNICLSSPGTAKQCDIIGCCWVNGKCQYPERQLLAENNASAPVVTGTVPITERRCVGLQKNECAKDWQTISQRNVTWVRKPSSGILRSSTPAGIGRNKARNVFDKQVLLLTYAALMFLIDNAKRLLF